MLLELVERSEYCGRASAFEASRVGWAFVLRCGIVRCCNCRFFGGFRAGDFGGCGVENVVLRVIYEERTWILTWLHSKNPGGSCVYFNL